VAKIGNLVQETTTSTGTGNLTVSSANGKRTFNTEFSTGGSDVFYYFISHQSAAEWEIGTGHLSAATTFVRDTVISSSNANALVNFSAGTKDVVNDLPASLQTLLESTTGSGSLVRATSPTLVTPVLGTPTSGTLTNCNGGAADSAGLPQNSQSTAYTAVLADANKHLLHPSADTTARTFTIPANGSVAYPIGTALTFVNQASAGVMTIAITTDTMRLAGAGTTGSRTLAANGIATALKITTTEWIISGTGLT